MQKILLTERHTKTTLLFSISRIFEKASYYGVRSLLLMYMINGSLNISEENSIAIYGYFAGSVIFSQLLGCVIGDLLLGNKKAIIIGGILQALGAFILCIPNLYVFYVGIGLISIGSGLFGPNIMSRFGKHYLNKKTLLDGGYSILSFSVSIGAMLGPFLSATSNYTYGFIISGILILISTSIHFFIVEPENIEFYNSNEPAKQNINTIILVISGIVLFWIIIDFMQVDLHSLGEKINILKTEGGIDAMTTINAFFGSIFGIIACFVWSYYYVNQLRKLFISAVLCLIVLSLLFIFMQINSDASMICIIMSITICLAEMLIFPILSSTLVNYTNTKYLTIYIGLSYIPFQIVNYLQLDNYHSYMYYITFGLIIIWLVFYFKTKKYTIEYKHFDNGNSTNRIRKT